MDGQGMIIFRENKMIRKLEAKDIVQILNIDDGYETNFDISKDQYVQILMSWINEDKYLIIGDDDNGKLKCYMIVKNNSDSPLYKSITPMHIWSPSIKDAIEMSKYVKDWAISLGIKRGLMSVPNDFKHSDKYIKMFGDLECVAKIYQWKINDPT